MTRITALTLALIATSLVPAAAQSMKPPAPLTPAQYAAAPLGSRIQIAVRVDRRVRSAVHAELLDRETDARYRATGTFVDLDDPDGTPVVMGTNDDVRPGAIVFVTGIVTGKRRADVKSLVVVTQYVNVVERT